MTDDSVIEEAANAIRTELERQGEASLEGPFLDGGEDDSMIVDGVVNLLEVARATLAVFEKRQSEPSDAQIDAALTAYVTAFSGEGSVPQGAGWPSVIRETMRAALRAAGSVVS